MNRYAPPLAGDADASPPQASPPASARRRGDGQRHPVSCSGAWADWKAHQRRERREARPRGRGEGRLFPPGTRAGPPPEPPRRSQPAAWTAPMKAGPPAEWKPHHGELEVSASFQAVPRILSSRPIEAFASTPKLRLHRGRGCSQQRAGRGQGAEQESRAVQSALQTGSVAGSNAANSSGAAGCSTPLGGDGSEDSCGSDAP